jgi:hypothetical protein
MTEHVRVQEDFYAIVLTMRPSVKDWDRTVKDVYFKADRYSAYSGRLQVEWDIEGAQRFKTIKGAQNAIARLIDKGTIKPDHNPRVVHYMETITRRWDEISADAVCADTSP